MDDYCGIASSDMLPDEIERIRPYVYDEISKQSAFPMFLKIHDAFIYTAKTGLWSLKMQGMQLSISSEILLTLQYLFRTIW